jgi:hypothetical protein
MDRLVCRDWFLPRPGEDVEAYIDVLKAPPEYELDEATKTRVMRFDEDLFAGNVLGKTVDIVLTGHERPDLLDLLKLDAKAGRVPVAYFLTDEGREMAAEQGLTEIANAETENDVVRAITRYSFDDPRKLRKDILGKADRWEKNRYTDAILAGEPIEESQEAFYLQNPQDFATKVRGLLAYSAFFRSVRRSLKEDEPTPEMLAKLAVVEIYQARINSELAGNYTELLAITNQLEALPSEYRQQWLEWLGAGFSSRLRLMITDRQMTERFAKRLDSVRNGMADGYGKNHRYRGVSRPILSYFESDHDREVAGDSVFTPEEVAKLAEISVNTATVQEWLEETLHERGLLSEHPYDIEIDRFRRGRAPDGKWQIAIDPSTDSLAVDKIKGIIKVADNFDRTLTSVEPVGAVPVVYHELTHVEQNERSYRSPYNLKLLRESIAKRAVLMREASGIKGEKKVHQELFGQNRKNNPHYMRALAAYEDTGDEAASIKAYVDSVLDGRALKDLPDKQQRSTVYKAVDRVRRITRRNGRYNSQPMAYAEQALIMTEVEQLDPELQDLVFAEASLDLPDMVRLHRFGLLKVDKPAEKPLPDIFRDKVVQWMKDKLEERSDGDQ